jgi:hypothetical protein
MTQRVQLKRSATPSKVPATTDLQLGEMAINTYDGKVYIKKDNGTESIVEVTPGVTSAATGAGTDKVFLENGFTVTTNYTLTANKNAGSFGPVTIADGIVVTIPTGAAWTIA